MSAAFIVCGVVFIGFSAIGWALAFAARRGDVRADELAATKDGGTYRTNTQEETL